MELLTIPKLEIQTKSARNLNFLTKFVPFAQGARRFFFEERRAMQQTSEKQRCLGCGLEPSVCWSRWAQNWTRFIVGIRATATFLKWKRFSDPSRKC